MDGCDVLVAGDVFLDLVFAGVDGVPRPGTEVRARDFGIAPGGIANQAIASRRLGLSVSNPILPSEHERSMKGRVPPTNGRIARRGEISAYQTVRTRIAVPPAGGLSGAHCERR